MKKSKSTRSNSFIKHQSFASRVLAPFRYYLYGVPLKYLFRLLEIIFAGVKKKYVLFLLPYGEFDENTRYMFEHCLRHPIPGRTPILFVFPGDLFEVLIDRYPENVIYAPSILGWKHFFQADIALTSRGVLINAFYPFHFSLKHKTLINMWHGIPLKRIHYLANSGWEKAFNQGKQEYSAMTVCSKIEQITMAASFRIGLDDVWITSTPRCDPLFKRINHRSGRFGKMILYAPTYRDGMESAKLFPFEDMSEDRLIDFLEEHDCTLIIRRHLLEKSISVPNVQATSRILIDDRSSIYDSLQDELVDADILITDYSSIYLDYLALNRPIIFIPYDMKEYEVRRGLMFDYEEVTPGPKVESLHDLLVNLNRYLNDSNQDADKRSAIRDQFHQYKDGRAAERIAQRIAVISQSK